MTTFASEIVETSSTTGTGTYTLNGPATAYRSFAQGYNTGDKPYYVVRNTGDTKYEVNRHGTFSEGSPNTLSRAVYLSSNGNAPVSWVAGDLPLLVYVPAANEVLEQMVTGFRAAARNIYLQFGLWFRKDYPSVNNDTLMIFNGVTDIPFATVDNTTNTATSLLSLPPGIIMDFAGGTAPAGTLLCAGQSVSRVTYAKLYAAIGTTYGAVDGATFNVPDLRGRVTIGKDNMGGNSAGRVTAASGFSSTVLGNAAGTETETAGVTVSSISVSGNIGVSGSVSGTLYGSTSGALGTHAVATTSTENGSMGTVGGGPAIGSHNHSVDAWGDTYGALSVSAGGSLGGSMSGMNGMSGTGSGATSAANNVQPGMILNKLISTGGV